MFSLFAPRYLKDAKLILKNARKLLHYKRDLLSQANVADFESHIDRLERAIREGDQRGVEETSQQLDRQWNSYLPPVKDAGWRENCEVFLVAIIIAVGVRTYFLQPFTIPTGSMQPTLNGIVGHAMQELPPNALRQIWDFVMRGRTYVRKIAKADETIIAITEVKSLLPFVEQTPFLGN